MSAQKNDQLLVQPIIVRKKVVHGGHHGGAWKVAYADFVTAMMALFIVLWLMNSSEQVKKAIAGYFRDPSGHTAAGGSGQSGATENIGLGKDDMSKLKDKLEAAIKQTPNVAKLKDQVQMTVTGEGLRIELLESAVSTFFETGNAHPTTAGREMLELLASELSKLPNRLSVEGHTDAVPYSSSNGYSNWELSTDRANSARKLIQATGVRPDQVADVRGYADQRLRRPEDPTNACNRRVSIVVKYLVSDAPAPNEPAEKSETVTYGKPSPVGETKSGSGTAAGSGTTNLAPTRTVPSAPATPPQAPDKIGSTSPPSTSAKPAAPSSAVPPSPAAPTKQH